MKRFLLAACLVHLIYQSAAAGIVEGTRRIQKIDDPQVQQLIAEIFKKQLSGDRLEKLNEPGARERVVPLPADIKERQTRELIENYSKRVQRDVIRRRQTAANRLARLTLQMKGMVALLELQSQYSADAEASLAINEVVKMEVTRGR